MSGSGPGLYFGNVTLDLSRANHGSSTGVQSYTLDDAQVQFGGGVDHVMPAAGSGVGLQGTITVYPKGCTIGVTTLTITGVEITRAK